MKIHYLRENTYIISDESLRILVNPVFGERITPLPLSIKDILKNINSIVITSFDNQHFDILAQKYIQKNVQIYASDNRIKDKLKELGYKKTALNTIEINNYLNLFNNINKELTNGEIILFNN